MEILFRSAITARFGATNAARYPGNWLEFEQRSKRLLATKSLENSLRERQSRRRKSPSFCRFSSHRKLDVPRKVGQWRNEEKSRRLRNGSWKRWSQGEKAEKRRREGRESETVAATSKREPSLFWVRRGGRAAPSRRAEKHSKGRCFL